eukprot:gene3408-3734_t
MILLFLLAALSVNFCLESVRGNTLRFLLLGDWGKGGSTGAYGSSFDDSTLSALRVTAGDDKGNKQGGGGAGGGKKQKTYYQVPVAKAMAVYANNTDPAPSFVIALGDNFYDNGVSSATDVLWDYLWKDIYLGYSSLRIPWYPVFGNHDYGGGAAYVQAQLARTQEHLDDDLWQFDAANYTKIFEIPGSGGATVQIVFVDTTTLAPSVNKCCNQNGGISNEVQAARIADQLSRITAILNATLLNPPTWLLVAGHYTMFSAGENGDISELQTYLLPLLQEFKVHAYICGHDHISEHLRYDGLDIFVAGAGSMADSLGKGSQADLIWYGVGYSAFGYMEATATNLTVGFVDVNNTLRYSYTLTNPNPLNAVPPIGTPIDPPILPPNQDEPNDGETPDNWFGDYSSDEVLLASATLVTMAGLVGLFFFVRGYRHYRMKKYDSLNTSVSATAWPAPHDDYEAAGQASTMVKEDIGFKTAKIGKARVVETKPQNRCGHDSNHIETAETLSESMEEKRRQAAKMEWLARFVKLPLLNKHLPLQQVDQQHDDVQSRRGVGPHLSHKEEQLSDEDDAKYNGKLLMEMPNFGAGEESGPTFFIIRSPTPFSSASCSGDIAVEGDVALPSLASTPHHRRVHTYSA